MKRYYVIEQNLVSEFLEQEEIRALEKKYGIYMIELKFDTKVIGTYENLKRYYKEECGIEIEDLDYCDYMG